MNRVFCLLLCLVITGCSLGVSSQPVAGPGPSVQVVTYEDFEDQVSTDGDEESVRIRCTKSADGLSGGAQVFVEYLIKGGSWTNLIDPKPVGNCNSLTVYTLLSASKVALYEAAAKVLQNPDLVYKTLSELRKRALGY